MAHRQTLLGVTYTAITRLPKESQPPFRQTLLWARDAEAIRGKNRLMNQEAARYTQLFAERGFKSAILKGQANARLYPDPFSRLPGDIDIWVPGGYEKVLNLLQDLKIPNLKHLEPEFHDIEFSNENKIHIEVHHRPSSTSLEIRLNRTNEEIQKILLSELENVTLTPEGFYTPSIRFALLMQLPHLYKHALFSGVSLRQYMDYYMLLMHSTEEDRRFTWDFVKKIGMEKGCAAIMDVLEHVFKLPQEKMLCEPNKFYGKILYTTTITEGDFGARLIYQNKHKLKYFFKFIIYNIRLFPMAPLYISLKVIKYWSWKRHTLKIIRQISSIFHKKSLSKN